MPRCEIEFYTIVAHNSREIAHELRIANELKAIELKAKYGDAVIALVDDAMAKR